MSSEFWLGVIVTTLIGFLLIPIQIWSAPRIQEWFEKRAISARTKSLSRLIQEYTQAKRRHQNLPRYQIYLFSQVMLALVIIMGVSVVILVALGVIWTGFSFFAVPQILQWFAIISAVIFLLSPCYMCMNLIRFVIEAGRLLNFEEYEKNALARIAELESRKPGDKATPQQEN